METERSKQEQNAAMKLHATAAGKTPVAKDADRGNVPSSAVRRSMPFNRLMTAGKATELYSLSGRNLPNALRALPKHYRGPVLGPPLPGDLGSAMVEKPVATTAPVEVLSTVDPYEAELKQKLRQEGETARTATLFTESQNRGKRCGKWQQSCGR